MLFKTYKVGDTLELTSSAGYLTKKVVKRKAKIVKRGPNWIKVSMRVKGEMRYYTSEYTITKSGDTLLIDYELYFKTHLKKVKKLK